MKDGGSEGEDKKRVSRGDAKGGGGCGEGGEAAKQNAKRKDGAVFRGRAGTAERGRMEKGEKGRGRRQEAANALTVFLRNEK